MKVRFLDRISGEECLFPKSPALPGQYQFLTDQAVVSQATLGQSGDFLVGDQDGKWAIRGEEEEQVLTGHFWDCGEMPKRERYSLREISRNAKSVLAQGGGTSDWLSISPVVMGARAKLQPFDLLLIRYLWHLQEVCQGPITHLRSEEVRLPVGRVRRASARAPEYLSAHTEDWEYRKIASVVPKRVLSVVSEELYDIYENRLAVRLVDKLLDYLRQRYEEVSKIEQWFDPSGLYSGTHWRQDRIYRLLAEAVNSEVDEMERVVNKAKRTLDRLYYEVMGLLDSPLYKAMPKVGRQSLGLQETNILVNDRHYRYVALLWRNCLETEYMRPRSRKEMYEEAQEVNQGFDSFSLLLTVKGMKLLGYSPEGDRPCEQGRPVLWTRGTAAAQLCWNSDGTIKVQRDGVDGGVLFVPLAAPLTSPGRSDVSEQLRATVAGSLSARLNGDRGAARDQSPLRKDLVVLLYPGDARERASLPNPVRHKTMTLGNDLHKPESLAFLPVSSYELDTLERIGRALQWALLRPQILDYPPKVTLAENAKDLLTVADWVEPASERGRASVLRMPRDDEKRRLDDALRAKLGRLRVIGKKMQPQIDWLTSFKAELDASYVRFDAFLQCPVCLTLNGPAALHDSRGEHFVCECDECHSMWGTRACGECGARYPFVTPSGTWDYSGAFEAGWVDAVYGLDVLAVPCWIPGCGNMYICPHCGVCGNAGRADCKLCTRCASV